MNEKETAWVAGDEGPEPIKISNVDRKDKMDNLIKLLREAWEIEPSWRFGQLMSNVVGPDHKDVFHVEDAELEVLLQHFIADCGD